MSACKLCKLCKQTNDAVYCAPCVDLHIGACECKCANLVADIRVVEAERDRAAAAERAKVVKEICDALRLDNHDAVMLIVADWIWERWGTK